VREPGDLGLGLSLGLVLDLENEFENENEFDLGSRLGDSGRHPIRIALGSAAEVSAVLDLVSLPGASEQQASLRRVGAMLARMAR
jgi:hypothetical protein